MTPLRPLLGLFVVLVLAGLTPLPAAAGGPGEVLAEGHIEAAPYGAAHGWTFLFGTHGHGADDALVDHPWAFVAAFAGHGGREVAPVVADNGGAGYFLEMLFLDADQRRIDTTCAPHEDDAVVDLPQGATGLHLTERCIVPDGTVQILVRAHHGYDLDVAVVALG